MFQIQTISRFALGLFVSISLAACAGASHQTATSMSDTAPPETPAALATFEKAAMNTVGGGALGAGVGAVVGGIVGVAATISCGPLAVGCAPFTVPAAAAAGAAIGAAIAGLMSVTDIIGDIELAKTELERKPASITATEPVLAETQVIDPDVSSDDDGVSEPNLIAAFFEKLDELLSPVFQVADAD
jgi:hypothetical protein